MATAPLFPEADAEASGRADRLPFLGFVIDAESESTVRQGLADTVVDKIDLRRGNIHAAIATLERIPTPRVILVDISGEENPFHSLNELSEVVEPDVRVLVIGERHDINFYRQITRNLGVADYLFKPITPEMVARYFAGAFGRKAVSAGSHGGRIVTVTGANGGVGATTVAVSLAWYLSNTARRYSLLIDGDLHRGVVALRLGAKTSSGLKTAIATPQRIDELFVERSAQRAGERLFVLAGEEPMIEDVPCAEGAVAKLFQCITRRYNFIIGDIPFSPAPFQRGCLDAAHQRVFVMEPTLESIRDTLRLLALPYGPQQVRRAVIVLNRLGQPGGLTLRQVEEALAIKPDVVIPYMPRQLVAAANLGDTVVERHAVLRQAFATLAREIGSMHRETGRTTRGLRALKHVFRRAS